MLVVVSLEAAGPVGLSSSCLVLKPTQITCICMCGGPAWLDMGNVLYQPDCFCSLVQMRRKEA